MVVVSREFVGRGNELNIMDRMRTALVEAGVGGAVAVVGEQGIGKSELLRVSLADASGFRLLWGVADEVGQPVPLTLMRQCLAGVDIRSDDRIMGTDWAAGVFASDPVLAETEGLLAAVDRLCAESPVVLVAEDLQWADEATVLAWRKLSRAVSQLPLLLAASFRPESARVDVAKLRRSLAVGGGTVLELGVLAPLDVDVLVEKLVGGRQGEHLAARMRWAGGNPLYVRELADGLVRDGQIRVEAGVAELTGGLTQAHVPEPLSAVIARRLAYLTEDVVAVLGWAAVLGQEFFIADLEIVTERPVGDLVDVITCAETAGVIADAGPRLAFRHGLIWEVLYQQMPTEVRVGMHWQAAQALAAARIAPERVAAQLNAALTQGRELTGGEPPEAVQPWVLDWLVRLSPKLLYAAPRVAADLLRCVLARLAADDPRRGQFETDQLTALFLLGQDANVEQSGRQLLARTSDPNRAGEASWLVAYAMVRAGRVVVASAVLDDARNRAGIGAGLAARLSALQGHILILLGRIDQSARAAQAALSDPAGDPIAPGYAHYVLSSVTYMRRDGQARLRHLDHGLAALSDDAEFTDLRLLLMSQRTNVLADLDRLGEALATGQQAVVLAERAGAPRGKWVRTVLAVNYYTSGRWDDALAVAELAIDSEHTGYAWIYAQAMAGLIAGHRGDLATAADHLSLVPDTAGWVKVAGPQSLHGPMLAWAVVAEQKDPGEAIAALGQCLAATLAELMPNRHVLLPDLTRLALAAGDTGLARAAAHAARQEAQREPLAWKQASADHCRGLVENDLAAVLGAASYAKGARRPLDYGQAMENAAVIAADRGDEALARERAADALDHYTRLGARWDISRASSRLLAHGIGDIQRCDPVRPDVGWDALTPTEVRVAHLVSRGLSNPDIASELNMSRNTVQTHVSHILSKLETRSRTDIRRLAAGARGARSRSA
jgi:DNA-binding CsgD family transcriptional regulator